MQSHLPRVNPPFAVADSRTHRAAAVLCMLSLSWFAFGQREVALYVSTDFEHAEPILKAFEARTGIRVLATPDTEDTKTIALVNRIITEAGHPKADVYWNNEAANTVRLKDMGLLEKYVSPSAEGIPSIYKDKDGWWTGFSGRVRVILVNTAMAKGVDPPTRVADFADPRWKGKCAMAKPVTGTTFTHAGVLYARDGRDRTDAWFEDLQKNDVRWEKGNGPVMKEVSEGGTPFGLTDTDDAHVAEINGRPVRIIYPDQGKDDVGAVVIPNTVMMLRGAQHTKEAQELIDYLLSPEVERALAEGRAAQIPLRPGVPRPAHVKGADELKVMPIDWNLVARVLDNFKDGLNARFENPGAPKAESGSRVSASTVIIVVLLLAALASSLRGRRRSAA